MLQLGAMRLQLVPIANAAGQQVRGFATLKDISIRLKSVKNVSASAR